MTKMNTMEPYVSLDFLNMVTKSLIFYALTDVRSYRNQNIP